MDTDIYELMNCVKEIGKELDGSRSYISKVVGVISRIDTKVGKYIDQLQDNAIKANSRIKGLERSVEELKDVVNELLGNKKEIRRDSGKESRSDSRREKEAESGSGSSKGLRKISARESGRDLERGPKKDRGWF